MTTIGEHQITIDEKKVNIGQLRGTVNVPWNAIGLIFRPQVRPVRVVHPWKWIGIADVPGMDDQMENITYEYIWVVEKKLTMEERINAVVSEQLRLKTWRYEAYGILADDITKKVMEVLD